LDPSAAISNPQPDAARRTGGNETMQIEWIRRMRSAAAALSVALGAHTATASQNQTLAITKIADGVYAAVYSEFRMDPVEGNSLIVIGSDGVLVLDSGRTPHAARVIIGEIRKLTALPVRHLVNSHWHDDHIFGNQAYVDAFPGIEIIAHRQTRADMIERVIPSLKDYGTEYWTKMAERFEGQLAKGTRADGSPLTDAQKTRLQEQARTVREFLPRIPSLSVALPTMTVDGPATTIHQGDREIRLLYLGAGNTGGDLAVYLPREKVLATGDLLVHPTPFAYGSDVQSWIGVLRQLRALDVETILPGHGPVMRDKAYLDLVIGLFESLVAQVTASVSAGLTLEETRKTMNLESFHAQFAGDDAFRRAMFADSILREAVERTYRAMAK
jgi:glyoxylase-like metal-dependent hydrolase (beta-lactamase superfamily II)